MQLLAGNHRQAAGRDPQMVVHGRAWIGTPQARCEDLTRPRSQLCARPLRTGDSTAHVHLRSIGYTARVTAIIREVLDEARCRLLAATFQPETREAGLLLGHVLAWSEAEVIARSDAELDESTRRRFESLLARRLEGEPVAYLLGEKEFYGRRFQVDDRVLIPRPETEHLVELTLELPLPSRPSILDLGTGSGCLACTLALEIPSSRIWASDISPDALAVAHRNLQQHDLSNRLQLVGADLALPIDLTRFDLIITNPPYIGEEEAAALSSEILDFEPRTALFAGAEGDVVYRRLLTELAALRSGCWVVAEIGANQADLIRQLTAESVFLLQEIHQDLAGRPRVALLRRR